MEYHLIQKFKALSDETRLQIILFLEAGELCVCKIVEKFSDVSQPKISQHLRILRDAHIVTTRKDGKNVMYKLTSKKFAKMIKEMDTL